MIIRAAKRSKTSYCRICGRVFNRGEKYVVLSGTHRVMRSLMCMEHFNLKDCNGCKDRLQCLTHDKMAICIAGGIRNTKVEEY